MFTSLRIGAIQIDIEISFSPDPSEALIPCQYRNVNRPSHSFHFAGVPPLPRCQLSQQVRNLRQFLLGQMVYHRSQFKFGSFFLPLYTFHEPVDRSVFYLLMGAFIETVRCLFKNLHCQVSRDSSQFFFKCLINAEYEPFGHIRLSEGNYRHRCSAAVYIHILLTQDARLIEREVYPCESEFKCCPKPVN